MPTFLDKQTGEPVFILAEEVPARLKAEPGRYVPVGEVNVRGAETGTPVSLPVEDFEGNVQGREVETAVEADERARERELDEIFGAQKLIAIREAVGRGLSLGATDAVNRLLGQSEWEMRMRRERNPISTTAAELLAMVLPAIVNPGAAAASAGRLGKVGKALSKTPAGVLARSTERAAGRVFQGAGTLSSGARGALQGALEGGGFEVGHALSQAALSDDPLTVESFASQLKSKNLLTGTALGGAAGGAFGLLGGAVRKLIAPTGTNKFLDGLSGDLRILDRSIQDLDVEKLTKEHALRSLFHDASRPSATTLGDDLGFAGTRVDDAFSPTQRLAPDEIDDLLGQVRASRSRDLGVPQPLVDDAFARADEVYGGLPAAVDEVQKARQALAKSLGDDLNLNGIFKKDADNAVRIIKEVDNYHKAATEVDKLLGGKLAVGEQFAGAGLVKRIQDSLPDGILDKFNAIDAVAAADLLGVVDVERIGTFGPAADTLLKTYAAARFLRGHARQQRATAHSPMFKSLVQGGAEGFVAPVGRGSGHLPRVQRNIFKRMVGFASTRMASVPMVAGAVPERVHNKARRAVQAMTSKRTRRGVLAATSTVLASTRFWLENDEKDAYQARARELREAIANEDQTREIIRKNVTPITAMNPSTGAQVQEAIWQRMLFLGSKLPATRRNLLSNLARGKDIPSPVEVAKWARYVRAAEDPLTLLDDLEKGSVTFEAVETVKTLYPTLFQEMQVAVMDSVGELRQALNYDGRVQLSLAFDVPVEPSMAADFAATLRTVTQQAAQAQTAGAPRPSQGTPKPQERATPAQRLLER